MTTLLIYSYWSWAKICWLHLSSVVLSLWNASEMSRFELIHTRHWDNTTFLQIEHIQLENFISRKENNNLSTNGHPHSKLKQSYIWPDSNCHIFTDWYQTICSENKRKGMQFRFKSLFLGRSIVRGSRYLVAAKETFCDLTNFTLMHFKYSESVNKNAFQPKIFNCNIMK